MLTLGWENWWKMRGFRCHGTPSLSFLLCVNSRYLQILVFLLRVSHVHTKYFHHICPRFLSGLPPITSHLPSNFTDCFLLFCNPLDSVCATRVHIVWDHPLRHWPPTMGHTPKDAFLPQHPSTVHSFSARGVVSQALLC